MELCEPVVRQMTEEEKKYYESGEWRELPKLEDWQTVGD